MGFLRGPEGVLAEVPRGVFEFRGGFRGSFEGYFEIGKRVPGPEEGPEWGLEWGPRGGSERVTSGSREGS